MRDCERLGLDQVVTPGPVTMPHLVCEHLPQEAVSALITAGAGMGRDSQETKQGKKKRKTNGLQVQSCHEQLCLGSGSCWL